MNKINIEIKNSNILIIDDEAANVKLLERILETAGYKNITSSQDPNDTVALFKEKNSDLILLDLNMPKLDGYAVMAKLNEIEGITLPPILVLTAQHMQSFRQRALDSGAIDYVTKPFDANELLSRVRNLLEVQMAHKFMRNQNEILEQKVFKRTQALNETRLQVVRCLGRAAEYRDEETGLHIIRMSKMAVILARASGMDEEQCDLLLNAAPMHDIGKIGIPDHILLKPGRFEPDEWALMQQHAQIGADILSEDTSDLMKMAHDIALTHHEKWNGEGYPNNLKGDEIPLVGRLCAISDVFDALTSKRPYKKAWSVDDAVKLILSESGKHFDPKLVNLFVENITKIESIKDKYAEPNN
jgi:putative two-component system response regulator